MGCGSSQPNTAQAPEEAPPKKVEKQDTPQQPEAAKKPQESSEGKESVGAQPAAGNGAPPAPVLTVQIAKPSGTRTPAPEGSLQILTSAISPFAMMLRLALERKGIPYDVVTVPEPKPDWFTWPGIPVLAVKDGSGYKEVCEPNIPSMLAHVDTLGSYDLYLGEMKPTVQEWVHKVTANIRSAITKATTLSGESWKAALRQGLTKFEEALEKHSTLGSPFFFGEKGFSHVDVAAWPYLSRLPTIIRNSTFELDPAHTYVKSYLEAFMASPLYGNVHYASAEVDMYFRRRSTVGVVGGGVGAAAGTRV